MTPRRKPGFLEAILFHTARKLSQEPEMQRRHFGTAIDGRPTFKRMQDLPADAFASGEVASRVFRRGDRSVLVLSHPWRSLE